MKELIFYYSYNLRKKNILKKVHHPGCAQVYIYLCNTRTHTHTHTHTHTYKHISVSSVDTLIYIVLDNIIIIGALGYATPILAPFLKQQVNN